MGLCTVMLTGIVLSGCAKSEDPVEKSKGKSESSKEVTLSVWAGEEDKDYIAKVAENFVNENASEANITINWTPMVEGECRSNLLGNVLEAADVYTTTDGDIQAIVAGGAASPVTNPDEIKANNLEASVASMTINDKIYGYPITADNGYFLYYNKKYLSDSDVSSLDKILRIAEKNKKKFAMDWTSGWYLYSFYGQTGLKVGLNEDGVTNFCDWNSTENSIKGVDVAEALLRISKSSGFSNTAEWINGIKKGDVIACVSGVWDESTIKAEWGDDYGAAKLPTYTCAGKQVQMSCYFGYKMMGVNPYSENLEWAHKFANYVANEENQSLRFEMRGQGPSNTNVANSEEVKQALAVQAVLAQSEFSELQRLGGNFWDPVTAFGTEMAKGNPSGGNLQKELDSMVKKITSSNIE